MTYETEAAPQNFPFTFHGSHTRSVDAKGRFNLPFQFRRMGQGPAEERYVVSKGTDGSLALLPHAVFLENFNRMRQGKAGQDLRRNLRAMSQDSHVVEPDAQGRVAIPRHLLDALGIAKKVTVVGIGNYLELWDPQTLAAIDAGDGDLDPSFTDEFFR